MFGAAAFNIFYWFNAKTIAASYTYYTHTPASGLIWPIRILVLVLTAAWLARTVRVETLYEERPCRRRWR